MTKKITLEEFLERSKEKHGSTYSYGKVTLNGVNTNVEIICSNPEHGSFFQTPKSHMRGSGCQKCGAEKRGRERREENAKLFKQRATLKHKGVYDYSISKYEFGNSPIKIIHKVCGLEFEQTPTKHLSGHGCTICPDNKMHTAEQFKADSQRIHGIDTYNYDLVIYNGNKKKVILVCPKHGEFKISPSDHIFDKNGCRFCGFERGSKLRMYTKEELEDKWKNIHGQRYCYSQVVYTGIDNKVIIYCKKCKRTFNQTPSSHFSGQGCYRCAKTRMFSGVSIVWLEFKMKEDNTFIQHALNKGEFHIPNTKFKADGYSPSLNKIYEFHGTYWHGDPRVYEPDKINKKTKKTFGELYQKTKDKMEELRIKGYEVEEMWEYDWMKLQAEMKK
jgi:hypothetical protein